MRKKQMFVGDVAGYAHVNRISDEAGKGRGF